MGLEAHILRVGGLTGRDAFGRLMKTVLPQRVGPGPFAKGRVRCWSSPPPTVLLFSDCDYCRGGQMKVDSFPAFTDDVILENQDSLQTILYIKKGTI